MQGEIVRRMTVIAAGGLAATALALTGCSAGGSGHPAASSAAPTSAAASPSATGASGHGGTATAVTVTLSDPVMGDRVVVHRLVRDFAVPASMAAVSDREIVLLDVTATAGSAYYAGFQTTQLAVVVDGEENQVSDTDDLDAAMTKAGYAPMPGGGDVDTGRSASGWVPFVVDPKDAPKLVLRMKRSAATTSDGKTITAHDFDAPLTR